MRKLLRDLALLLFKGRYAHQSLSKWLIFLFDCFLFFISFAIKNASISYINDSGAKTVYSNERGVFQFENIHYGRYDFVVEKTGYEIKNVDNLNFFDRRRILCFQLTSKISFFNKIDALFKNNQFEKAILKIESMNTNGDMNLYNLCSLYKSFGYFKLNNISKARKELDEVKKHNCCFSYSILEEKLEGK